MIDQKQLISWETHEFVKKERSASWSFYIIGGTIVLVLMSVYLKNFLFVVFLVIAVSIILINKKRSPEIIRVVIKESGVVVGSTMYPFSNISSFCIREEDGENFLILETPKSVSHRVIVPTGDSNEKEVRNILSKKLKEKLIEKSIVDDIIDYLGF